MSEPSVSVVLGATDPTLSQVAERLRAAFVAPSDPEPATAASSPIAMPVGATPPPVGLAEADVALALDGDALQMAEDAQTRRRVALAPGLSLAGFDRIDADLVLVAHEALVEEAYARGARRGTVEVVGPVAPEGWGPADRAASREAHPADSEAPWVVVRAAALSLEDLGAALVQLSLVSSDAVWLFDVGDDPELARALRRRVPGHGLAAWMFADAEAKSAYGACDAVLGSVRGPSFLRAMSVGAAMIGVPPRQEEARLAHALEAARLVDFADALATLAVTIDAGLAEAALAAGRAASASLDAEGSAGRVVEAVGRAAAETTALQAHGLPAGFERLDEGDGGPALRPPREAGGEEDKRIDEELAALRAKLGL